VNGLVLARGQLSPRRRRAMFELLERSFSGVSHPAFIRDLENKSWVVLLEDERSQVQGFTSLDLYDSHAPGFPVQVVCSGDTIVDPSARGTTLLARTWLAAVFRMRTRLPLYWLLICSGYRTYRLLPVFLEEFWPSCDASTPPAASVLLSRLAFERWGSMYDPRRGIVRLPNPQVLRSGSDGIPAGRLRDPHVAHFAVCNPGHDRGDELVCLAELSERNLTPAGRRILRQTRVRSKEAV
jgi:hypothetical protein